MNVLPAVPDRGLMEEIPAQSQAPRLRSRLDKYFLEPEGSDLNRAEIGEFGICVMVNCNK